MYLKTVSVNKWRMQDMQVASPVAEESFPTPARTCPTCQPAEQTVRSTRHSKKIALLSHVVYSSSMRIVCSIHAVDGIADARRSVGCHAGAGGAAADGGGDGLFGRISRRERHRA